MLDPVRETSKFYKTVGEIQEKYSKVPSSTLKIIMVTSCFVCNDQLQSGAILNYFSTKRYKQTRNAVKLVFRGTNLVISIKDRTKEGKRNFNNQLTLFCVDVDSGKKRSMKIFTNGSIHVTGCYSLVDIGVVITVLNHIRREVYGEVAIPIRPEQATVALINSQFNVNCKVNLRKLVSLFSNPALGYEVTYSPEKYAGAMLRFPPTLPTSKKGPSVKAFASGSMIISGVKTLKETAFVYNHVMNIVNNNREDMCPSEQDNKIEYSVPPYVDTSDVCSYDF